MFTTKEHIKKKKHLPHVTLNRVDILKYILVMKKVM